MHRCIDYIKIYGEIALQLIGINQPNAVRGHQL